MKKLILKCALLCLIVGGLLHLGGEAYKRTNTYLNLERTEQTDTYRKMPEQIDIAVFGASHGREDFKTAPEGAVMFNFALSSQTPEYDLRLMRQYEDRIRPGALVVLTVSPMYPFYLEKEEDFLSLQPRYYRILPPWNIVRPDWEYALRLWISPLLTEDYEKIAGAVLHPEPLLPTYDERRASVRLQPKDLSKEKERIHKNHIAPDSTAFPVESPVMADSYREMLTLCQEKGWRAVLVTPPYTAEYLECYEEYSSDFFPVLEQFMAGLTEEYGVPWLDYSRDAAFSRSYELFADIDHLNPDGAAEFDKRFFEDIRALGFLG